MPARNKKGKKKPTVRLLKVEAPEVNKRHVTLEVQGEPEHLPDPVILPEPVEIPKFRENEVVAKSWSFWDWLYGPEVKKGEKKGEHYGTDTSTD